MSKFEKGMGWLRAECSKLMDDMDWLGALRSENHTCAIGVPSSRIYFKHIDILSLILLIIAMLLTVAMILMYIFELYFILKYVSSNTTRPGKLAWLAAIYPYTSIGCIIALCVPRAIAITEIFVLLYLARCMFVYIELVLDYFGGRQEMSKVLEASNQPIQLNIRPLCCCCIWCPKPKPTVVNLRRIELMVYQVAILRPIMFLINGVIWADLFGAVESKQAIFTTMTVLQLLSTFIAMYGFLVFAQMCAVPLKEYNIRVLMKLAQFVIVFYNLQGNIFNLIANGGSVACTPLLPATTRASMWNLYLLILEVFILSVASAYFLRPKVNATFNLHIVHLQNENSRKSLLKRANTRDFETQTMNDNVLALAKQLAQDVSATTNNNNTPTVVVVAVDSECQTTEKGL